MGPTLLSIRRLPQCSLPRCASHFESQKKVNQWDSRIWCSLWPASAPSFFFSGLMSGNRRLFSGATSSTYVAGSKKNPPLHPRQWISPLPRNLNRSFLLKTSPRRTSTNAYASSGGVYCSHLIPQNVSTSQFAIFFLHYSKVTYYSTSEACTCLRRRINLI